MARNQKGRWPLKLISAALAACFAQGATALPTAPTVASGTATFTQTGNALTVTNSDRAIINWNTFSIAGNESVNFVQPTTTSSVLNRVLAADPSVLLGALTSNGKVFLINPAGILVGAGARIDTAGFVASTLSLSNADFLANRLNFVDTPGAGAVRVEKGAEIKTASGGQVYLVAPQVENSGVITTPQGEIILAAGRSVELLDTGTPGVKVSVVAGSEQALNLGQLVAESGRIGMVGAVVRQQGTVNASSLVREGGRIFLKATQSAELAAGSQTLADGTQGGRIEVDGGALTTVSGTVSATGSTAGGGHVEVLGDKVGVLAGASVDASGETGGGTILVGGDYQGQYADVRNADISYLGAGVTLRADARTRGNGGKVIVWADDTTRAYGSISARGGALGGDGGFVEVSGKRSLDFAAQVDTSAAHGLTGTLLLDPNSVTIYDGPATAIGGASWTQTGGVGATLQWSTINTQLQSTNVTITTNDSGGAGDDIVFSAAYGPMTASASATNTLILNANDKIVFNQNVDLKGGLQATAGTDLDVAAIVRSAGSQSISVGGNINVAAATNSVGLEMTNTAGSQSITAGGTLIVTGGTGANSNGYIKSAGTQTISANALSLVAGNGSVNARAQIDAVGLQTITTTSGGITVSGSTAAEAEISSDTGQTFNIAGNVLLQGGAGASAGAALITAPVQNITIGGTLTLQAGTGSVTDSFGMAAPAAIGYDAGADITLNVAGAISLNGTGALNPAIVGAAAGVADVEMRGASITGTAYSHIGNWAFIQDGSVELFANSGGISLPANSNIVTGSLAANAATSISMIGSNYANYVDLIGNGPVTYYTSNANTTHIEAIDANGGNIVVQGVGPSTSIALGELTTTGAGTITVSAQKQILDDNGSGVANLSTGTGTLTLTSQGGTPNAGELAISADVATSGQVNANVVGGPYGSIRVGDVGANQASAVILNASAATVEGDVGYFRYGNLALNNISLGQRAGGSVMLGATGDITVPTAYLLGAGAGDATLIAGGNLLVNGANIDMRGSYNTVIVGGLLSVGSGRTLRTDPGTSMDVVAGSILLNGGSLKADADLNVITPGYLDINGGTLESTTGYLDFIVGGNMKVVGTVSAGTGIIGDAFGGLTLGAPVSGTGSLSAGGGAVDLMVGGTGIAMHNGSYINSTDLTQPGGGLITIFFPGLSAGGSTIDGVATFNGGYKLNGALTTLGQGLDVSYGIVNNVVSNAILAATTSVISSGGGTSQTSGSLALVSTAPTTSGGTTTAGETTQTIGGTPSTFGSSEAGATGDSTAASGDGSTTPTESGQTAGGKQEEKTNAKKKPAQCAA